MSDAHLDEPRDVPMAGYVVAFAAYVILGLVTKSVVLNWIVGPLFLLLALYVLPALVRRLRS